VGHRAHELRSDGRHVYWFFTWREYSTVKSEQKASLEKASANRRKSKELEGNLLSAITWGLPN
jgi:hypothetical protein